MKIVVGLTQNIQKKIIRNKEMGCLNPVSIIFICLFSVSNLQYTTAQQDYVYHVCSGANYTTNGTFQTNLNLLFPSSVRNRYYNATVGRNPDTVYGSFQCRGDVSLDACQTCVDFVAQEFNNRCPNSKQAIVWYEKCMLRYSNQNYFAIMQDTPVISLLNANDVSNPDEFNQVVRDLMNDLAGEAGSSLSTNFAYGDKNITNSTKVYGLVQCTADLPSSNCGRCLQRAISGLPKCCDGKEGGRVIGASCNIRYELYPFFDFATAPPPPPSATNETAPNAKRKNTSKLTISIVVPSVIAVFSSIAFGFFCFRRRKTQQVKSDDVDDETPSTDSLQFNFSTVSAATDNFSEANKLGEGGFGSVYKGTLPDGRDIAVKRLSEYSGQGEQEFKNEVTLVAKLQHRNLVKLVGFSLSGEEKLLIYDFMSNASLDQFLFDPVKRTQLDWERRRKIIGGVARGLVYLHEESRHKIIHRDLKASNILLDMNMNPKIADFGLARLFVHDQTQASTRRIVGTHGYMAPEYVLRGHFSVKSDVFSFGVLVLEVLSGQKNSSFDQSDIAQDLLSYAWRHWKNGSAMEVLDPSLKDKCSRNEVARCIHVALLCVQEKVGDRPTMPTVVQMLNSYSATDPALPLAPAFFAGYTTHMEDPESTLGYTEEQGCSKTESIGEAAIWSVNDVSVTELYPR